MTHSHRASSLYLPFSTVGVKGSFGKVMLNGLELTVRYGIGWRYSFGDFFENEAVTASDVRSYERLQELIRTSFMVNLGTRIKLGEVTFEFNYSGKFAKVKTNQLYNTAVLMRF